MYTHDSVFSQDLNKNQLKLRVSFFSFLAEAFFTFASLNLPILGAKIHFCILLVLEVWDSDRTACIAVGLWYRMMSAHKRWVFQRAAAQQRQRRLALKPPLLFSERWLHDVCYCGLKKCFFIAWPLTTFVQPSIISKLNLLSDYFQEKWNNWGLKFGNDLNKSSLCSRSIPNEYSVLFLLKRLHVVIVRLKSQLLFSQEFG